jgi:cyclophilin family peptidyl-prolyl cis-trans isomerase
MGNAEDATLSRPGLRVSLCQLCVLLFEGVALHVWHAMCYQRVMRLLPLLCRTTVLLTLMAALAPAQTHRPAQRSAHGPEPTGPIAVFDTTSGRMTCRLYEKQAPKTVANFITLAQGTRTWHDAMNLTDVHDKPFYDGTAIAGITDGIRGGDRFGGGEGPAGPPIPEEKIPGVTFDRPGRLAMATHQGEISSSFYLITLHADDEFDKNHRGAIFGQCDDASIAVAATISHTLMQAGNRVSKAIAINKLRIVPAGSPLPPITEDLPQSSIVPQPVPPALATMPAPDPKGPTAVIETTMGTLTCRLFREQAPIATATFTELAEGKRPWTNPLTHVTEQNKHYYNGLLFNRVLPDFMIQQQDYPEGAPDAGFHYSIETVPGLEFDRPGRMAMANDGPDKNDSSFFITDAPAHSLDNKFTIFGQCDEASTKLVSEIARVPRNGHNRPVTPVAIKSVTIQP